MRAGPKPWARHRKVFNKYAIKDGWGVGDGCLGRLRVPRICLPVSSGGESYWASQCKPIASASLGNVGSHMGPNVLRWNLGPFSNFHRPSRDTDTVQVQEPLLQCFKGSVSGGFSPYQEPKLKASSVLACCALLDRPLLATQWQMACPRSTLQSAWCDS